MSNENTALQIPSKPDITEVIIFALRQEYEPLASWDPSEPAADVEFLTTIDLMEEISGFGTTDIDTITRAMLKHGFTIRTHDGKAYWLLRKK